MPPGHRGSETLYSSEYRILSQSFSAQACSSFADALAANRLPGRTSAFAISAALSFSDHGHNLFVSQDIQFFLCLSGVQFCGRILQKLNDRKMLRTYALALTAADAVRSFAAA